MKEDEKQFLILVYEKCKRYGDNKEKYFARDLINSEYCTIHHKRCWYLLEKWTGQGLYDYGVTLDLGWLTDKGVEKAKELLNEN